MNEFSVGHAGREGAEPFSNYFYRVFRGERCVAEISHTYRGDEHFIRQPGGEWQSTDQLIEGGGQQPLRLSSVGVQAIEKLISD